MEKKYVCKYCGKEFETFQKLGGHVSCCKLNPIAKEKIKVSKQTLQHNLEKTNPIEHHILNCCICGKEYGIKVRKQQFNEVKYKKTCSRHCAAILTAKNTNLEEKNNKISNSFSNKEINKEIKYRNCDWCGKEYEIISKSKFCCIECRNKSKYNKLSNIAKKCNFGGYYQNSIKKHHKGNYKGIHCDSSWELAYVVYSLEHNIKIERYTGSRKYIINNQEHKYYPDFIINDNTIIEIKGYYDKCAEIKSLQNPDIVVLKLNDLKEILNYVNNKYGNKFWEVLYDK